MIWVASVGWAMFLLMVVREHRLAQREEDLLGRFEAQQDRAYMAEKQVEFLAKRREELLKANDDLKRQLEEQTEIAESTWDLVQTWDANLKNNFDVKRKGKK